MKTMKTMKNLILILTFIFGLTLTSCSNSFDEELKTIEEPKIQYTLHITEQINFDSLCLYVDVESSRYYYKYGYKYVDVESVRCEEILGGICTIKYDLDTLITNTELNNIKEINQIVNRNKAYNTDIKIKETTNNWRSFEDEMGQFDKIYYNRIDEVDKFPSIKEYLINSLHKQIFEDNYYYSYAEDIYYNYNDYYDNFEVLAKAWDKYTGRCLCNVKYWLNSDISCKWAKNRKIIEINNDNILN